MSKKKKKDKEIKKQLKRREEKVSLAQPYGRDVEKQLLKFARDGQFEEARDLLLPFAENQPKNVIVLTNLAEMSSAARDFDTLFWASDSLITLGSNDFYVYGHRFNAALGLKMPAVSIVTAKIMRQLPHEPEHEQRLLNFQKAAKEKEFIEEFRREATLSGDDYSSYDDDQILNLLVDHERALHYLQAGRPHLVIEICDSIIRRCPIFRSAYNNKSLAILLYDGAEKAGPALDKAVSEFPNNVFAVSFKIQQLAKLGQREEIPALLERIRSIKPWKPKGNFDFFSAKIDAFAWAEDEQGVLDTYEEAKENAGGDWDMKDNPVCAHITHYAAVGHALRGETNQAKDLWQQAVRCPGCGESVKENYDDIRRPEWDQNGPAYFNLNDWIPRQFMSEMLETYKRYNIEDQKDEDAHKRLIEKHIFPLYRQATTRWPYLKSLCYDMLRRGDEQTRKWVLLTVTEFSDPKLIDTLTDFASGRHGSDSLRSYFLHELETGGLVKSGLVTYWKKGQPTQQYVFVFKTHQNRNPSRLSKRGLDILTDATNLMTNGKLDQALEMLEELNEKEPNDASVLFNIAMCKEYTGRHDEYVAIIDRLLDMYPDYFFAKVGKAKCLAREERFEESYEILTQYLSRSSFHISEAILLLEALTVYHMLKGEEDIAYSVYQEGNSRFPNRFPLWEQLRREAGLSVGWSGANLRR